MTAPPPESSGCYSCQQGVTRPHRCPITLYELNQFAASGIGGSTTPVECWGRPWCDGTHDPECPSGLEENS